MFLNAMKQCRISVTGGAVALKAMAAYQASLEDANERTPRRTFPV